MLRLHVLAFDEYSFRQKLLSDQETMAYNRGYAPFSGYHPDTGCIDCTRKIGRSGILAGSVRNRSAFMLIWRMSAENW